jgi:hypothetical protein
VDTILSDQDNKDFEMEATKKNITDCETVDKPGEYKPMLLINNSEIFMEISIKNKPVEKEITKLEAVGHNIDLEMDQGMFDYMASLLLMVIIFRGLVITLEGIAQEAGVIAVEVKTNLLYNSTFGQIFATRSKREDLLSSYKLADNISSTTVKLIFAKAIYVRREIFNMNDTFITYNSYGNAIATNYLSIDKCNSQFSESEGALDR